jgi:signal transduction histidine kinase
VFHGSARTATIAFGHEQPYVWNEQEAAFARAVASLVGLLISAQRNSETLAALDFAGDGICIEDEMGKVQYSNRAARQFSRDRATVPDYALPPLGQGTEHDRHEIGFAGRDLEIHRTRLPGGGLIARIADITERNRAAAERDRLKARLHQAAKMEAIGQLAGGVSHDFNNILAAIAGFGGFIAQDQNAGSENRAFARRILNACDRGKEVVEQIVAFADTGVVEPNLVDLELVIRRCHGLLASGMHPGAMLEMELPAEPPWIAGNEVQIGRLISNLVVNARDALDGRGGSIEVSAAPAPAAELEHLRGALDPAQRLFGEFAPGRRYVRLRVSDTGPGIAPELMDRVFEPFFTTKGRERGTGLGLAVVHGVVVSHGGVLHLRSAPGKGTVFSVYLPLAAAPQNRSAVAPAGNSLHVLIVDDEVDITDLLSIGLERLGFQTVAVQDPREALAAVQEDPGAFDAVLTDYDMAPMPGTELIRGLKAAAPGLRVVLCTGRHDVAEQTVLAAGADAFLRKPADIDAIARALSGPLACTA